RSVGTPLGEYVQGRFYRGVLTGLNKAFVIDGETRKQLIAEDPKSEELIKPWLRGRDIKKWKAEWDGLYLVNIPSSANKQWPWSGAETEKEARRIFKQTYPAIHNHLSQWEDKLRKRDDQGKFWWELRSCKYYEAFEQPKIIYPNITKTNIFAFDSTGILTNQKCFIIPSDDLYLLAILNSKLTTKWFFSTLPLLRGRFFEPSAIFMQNFPVCQATDSQKTPIIEHVKKILSDPHNLEISIIEEEINRMVYEIYELSEKEIKIIEGNK
ncbi:MAG: class I SAM-dependent DNA methyltransferase, partial [Chlorobi bacterium]|nr:class I SAM-dependent DNA methyltransferase [Chlorobiota bacterium]